MDYSNYIKEHPNTLIITNTEEEFVDVGTKLGWSRSECIQRWGFYTNPSDRPIMCTDNNLNYYKRSYYLEYEIQYKHYKRISYSEFLGVTEDYQIY